MCGSHVGSQRIAGYSGVDVRLGVATGSSQYGPCHYLMVQKLLTQKR